ncbi:MAG: MFS transporter [Phycisphaerales bacterium]|nr:MAG: MFS transporter [Phycisphaerales bacterium]
MLKLVERYFHAVASFWPLYGAAFAMAICLSVWWTAMPFVMRNIGGTEAHVGYAWAANMLGYMCGLLLAGAVPRELNPKHTTQTATAVMCAAAVAMGVVVYRVLSANPGTGDLTSIWIVIAAGTVAGVAMSLFWPFIMSWVSADFEGPALNRRLGTYNGAWSGAAIIGPLIGGVLVETNTLLPIVVAAVFLVICLMFLTAARDGSIHARLFEQGAEAAPAGGVDRAVLVRYRWMARISLFCTWVCLGVSRSQFALLFTGMGYSETWFGIIITVFAICNFLVLTVAGRYAFWHFRPGPLLGIQALISMSLLLIIYGHSLWIFVVAFVLMGCGFGFAYSSHLYYGTSASKKRSLQMVIHETTISVGIIIGAGAGGYLAKNVGTYSPYWFSVAVFCAGLVAQIAILLIRRSSSSSATDGG